MKPDPGDLIDPKTGEIIEVGQIKAKGITGTGVIALIEKAPKIGLIPYSTGKIAQIGNTSLAVAKGDPAFGRKAVGTSGHCKPDNRRSYNVCDCPECKKCIKVCPNDAITIDEENRVMISTDLCEGAHCQKCIRACPPDKFNRGKLKVFKPLAGVKRA